MLYVKPTDDDVLGDAWSARVRRVWCKMQELDEKDCDNLRRISRQVTDGLCEDDSPGITNKPGVYEVWQWMQCKAAGLESRVVASPLAMSYAGNAIPDQATIAEVISLSDRALNTLVEELRVMQSAWSWGGVPFYEIPLNAPEFREYRQELRKADLKLMSQLSLVHCTRGAFLSDCAKHLGIPHGSQKTMIELARAQFCS